MDGENLDILQNYLGYKFKNIKFLKRALTHSSYVNENNMKIFESNERLEFLGDAVIGLIAAEYFFRKYHEEPEGTLSKKRSSVVNEHSLAIVARNIRLGDMLLFGNGESKNGGKNRESILADALEAVIGSIYLDSDLETAKNIFYQLFDIILDIDDPKVYLSVDYKSKIQEVIQKKGQSVMYKLINEIGPDNDKTFTSQIEISGKIMGIGTGKTKKKSEQEAARVALRKLGDKYCLK